MARVTNDNKSYELKLLVPLLMKSPLLRDLVKNDRDRRFVIRLKGILSKHTLYKLLKDFTNDPYNKRWEFNTESSFRSPVRHKLLDKRTNTSFMTYSFKNKDDSDYYHASQIRVYINSDDDLLNDVEKVLLFAMLESMAEIETNLKELEKQQQKIERKDKIRSLY